MKPGGFWRRSIGICFLKRPVVKYVRPQCRWSAHTDGHLAALSLSNRVLDPKQRILPTIPEYIRPYNTAILSICLSIWPKCLTYHHVRVSVSVTLGSCVLVWGRIRFKPMARAVLQAKPRYMYATVPRQSIRVTTRAPTNSH